MSWVRFSLAVLATSVAVVIALFATGAFVVGNAFASAQHAAFDHDVNLPPELASLKDVPADQRFSHFKGITANLTDKDGKPILILVTPGVATTAASVGSSLTINGNDGSQHTYAIDSDTFMRGKTVTDGEDVVVITLNNSSTARAVVATSGDWKGRHGR